MRSAIRRRSIRSTRAGVFGTIAAMWMAGPGSAQEFPVSPSLPPESRQFDFWIGEWAVDLRMQGSDGSWQDGVTATAHVYPILSGKAVLELWSDDRPHGIKGYSLRAFDAARDEWVLWLNWPGPNRSGSSSLSGSFRHGRGEFYSSARADDGSETISRYTFSDITPNSLRWDDGVSRDGGRSWSSNWIMEFTRSAAHPRLPEAGGAAPTYHDGTRCTDPAFGTFDFLSGHRSGAVEAGGSGSVTIVGYRILDGCAVMTFAGADGDPERAWGFSHLTFNTYADRYELTTLNSLPGTPVRVFYSRDARELVLYERSEGAAAVDRFRIERHADGSVLWVHETPEGDDWRPVWAGRVR